MELSEYLPLAIRTAKPLPTLSENLNHAALGIASEIGELTLTVAQAFMRLPFELRNIPEEIGDCSWYAALMAHTMNWTFESLILQPDVASDMSPELAYAVVNTNPVAMTLCANAFSGEILSIVKAHVIYGKELDKKMLYQNLALYVTTVALLADLHRFSYIEVALVSNIQKLAKRYPESYTDAAALLRMDKQLDAEPPKSPIIVN